MKKITAVQPKDQIAQILREYIISGRLAPETEIVQEELAEQLQLSRTPVREVLQVLEQDGYLERLPNRHMRVNPTTSQDILMIFQVVSAMEGELLGILADMETAPEALRHLKEDYEMAVKQGAWTKSRELEKEFHLAISHLTGNHYLQKLHQKTLSGYPFFAMDQAKEGTGACATFMNETLSLMSGKDKIGLRSVTAEYFRLLALRIEKDANK